jgi:hypothetical protein
MCEVNRCKASSPRRPLPSGPDTYEGEHGAVYTSAFSGYQLKRCVRNNYPPIVAQSWDHWTRSGSDGWGSPTLRGPIPVPRGLPALGSIRDRLV